MKLKDERHQYILDQIEQKRIARVLDLSKDLNVAEMTIRRDLKELESQGYLQRIHGGAKALSSPNPTIYKEQSRQDKKAMNTAAKKSSHKSVVHLSMMLLMIMRKLYLLVQAPRTKPFLII